MLLVITLAAILMDGDGYACNVFRRNTATDKTNIKFGLGIL